MKMFTKRKARKLWCNPREFYRDSTRIKQTQQTLLRSLFWNKSFSLIVLLPVFLLGAYYLMYASDRYESTATIIIKKNTPTPEVPGLSTMLLGSNSSSVTSSYQLMNYIQSFGMYQDISKSVNILGFYQQSSIDWFSRLGHTPNQKNIAAYYDGMTSAIFDPNASTLQIGVQAYSPQAAEQIMQTMLVSAQSFIDHISFSLAEKRLEYSQKQVKAAKDKLYQSTQAVLAFQNKNNLIDPKSSLESMAQILASLQTQLITAETKLIDMQSYLQPSSAAIVAESQKIQAIKTQIETQKSTVLGDSQTDTAKLNTLMSQFEWLRLNTQFAIAEYKVSMQNYEMAKSDTAKRQEQLVIIQPPSLPDYAAFPRVWYNLLTLFLILLLVYGIGRLMITIIQEHRD